MAGNTVWNEDWDKVTVPTPGYHRYAAKYVTLGVDHCQDLVEGVTLASVDPPQIEYELKMWPKFYSAGTNGQYPHVSKPQLEAILYACQAFTKKFKDDEGNDLTYGFYLGDGTGVGKSRTLAGISYECMLNGTEKTIWMTASKTLFKKMKDEIKDFNKLIQVWTIEKLRAKDKDPPALKQVLLVTYNIFNNQKYIKTFKKFIGRDFDGCLFFDEAHYAKGAFNPVHPSKRGIGVVNLQRLHPNAKVVYATATGASEVSHLISFQRLGLWGMGTPFKEDTFKTDIIKKGVGACEVLAMELKSRGLFVSRHISLDNVEIQQIEVPVNNAVGGNHFEILYKRVSQIILLATEYMKRKDEQFLIDCGPLLSARAKEKSKGYKGQHYSACQLLFGNLIVSSKVATAAKTVVQSILDGHCAIVGVQHTGEAMFERFLKERDWSDGLPYSNIAYILRSILRALGVQIGCPKTYVRGQAGPVKIGNWTGADEAKADAILKELWRPEDVRRSENESTGSESEMELDDDIGDESDVEEDEDESAEVDDEHDSDVEGDEDGSDVEGDEDDSDVEDDEDESNDDNMHESEDDNEQQVQHEVDVGMSQEAMDVDEIFGNPDMANDSQEAYENFLRWPMYSVGVYVENGNLLDDPQNITWSYDEVRRHITPEGLARLYHELFPFFPINSLDELVNRCLDKRVRVGDLTGRTNTYKYEPALQDGQMVTRWSVFQKPETGKTQEAFMKDRRDMVIISSCSSLGISLHADRNEENKRKRIHITLEYGWGPENFMQQLGRSHRSNQATTPKYVMIRSRVPAEERYSCVMSKRVKQMSTMSHGTLEASSLITNVLKDDFCTLPGAVAVNQAIIHLSVREDTAPLISSLEIKPVKIQNLDKKASYFTKYIEGAVNRIFNRIMMVSLDVQPLFFAIVRLSYEKIMDKKCIHPPLCDIDLTKYDSHERIMSETKRIKDKVSFVYGFEVDRIAEVDFARDLIKRRAENWSYFGKWPGLVEVVLAKKNDNDEYEVVYPHCKYPKILPNNALEAWRQLDTRQAERIWRRSLTAIHKDYNQCAHLRLYSTCPTIQLGKAKCTYQWGKIQCFVITNPTSWLISILDEEVVSFELVRVKFPLRGTDRTEEEVGLLVAPQNCTEENLGHWIISTLEKAVNLNQ